MSGPPARRGAIGPLSDFPDVVATSGRNSPGDAPEARTGVLARIDRSPSISAPSPGPGPAEVSAPGPNQAPPGRVESRRTSVVMPAVGGFPQIRGNPGGRAGRVRCARQIRRAQRPGRAAVRADPGNPRPKCVPERRRTKFVRQQRAAPGPVVLSVAKPAHRAPNHRKLPAATSHQQRRASTWPASATVARSPAAIGRARVVFTVLVRAKSGNGRLLGPPHHDAGPPARLGSAPAQGEARGEHRSGEGVVGPGARRPRLSRAWRCNHRPRGLEGRCRRASPTTRWRAGLRARRMVCGGWRSAGAGRSPKRQADSS